MLDSGESIVTLRRAPLVAAVRALRQMNGRAALQAAVAALQATIADPSGPLAAAGGDDDVVTLGAEYLPAELDQIAAAQTLERAFYYVDRLVRALTTERTSAINDINLNRWKAYDDIITDSLWNIERRDSSGVHSAGYWGNFVPQIPYQMMRRYTRPGEWVLDPFAGSGTTLIEGQRLGRHVLGVELQAPVVDHARSMLAAEPNRHHVTLDLQVGDSTSIDFCALLRRHGVEQVQLAILHPPYHDIIHFSDDPRDLSNAPSVEAFLVLLGRVVDHVLLALESGRYLVLVIGDTFTRGDWIPLGFLAMETLRARGLGLKSIVVKNFESTLGKRNQKELWRYRALAGGFYIFKHEYIFIFRAP